jgi:DNA-binding MarR family transcriptional regulator
MADRERPRRDTTPEPDRVGVSAALYGLVSGAVRRIPRDMSLTSLSTLATLDRTGPRRITDLAVVEAVAQPSMTVLVTGLERDGLVERRGDPSDGRVALVALTEAGSALLRARRSEGAASFVHLIDKLPADEAAALVAAVPALEHLRQLDDEERERPTQAAGRRGEVFQ